MKKIVSFVLTACMLLLFCMPGMAAESIELNMAADTSVVEPGGTVTVTFALSGASNAAIEGISFYVNFTDGIWVKSSTINCGSDFMLSSYNAKSRLFSATIANGDSTPDNVNWKLLTLKFQVRDTASGEQSVSVVTDSSDSQWSLFDSNYADLSCSGDNAKVNFTVNSSGSSGEDEGNNASDTTEAASGTNAETAADSSAASSFVNNTGVELEGGTTSGETFYYTESGEETSPSPDENTLNDSSESADEAEDTADAAVISASDEAEITDSAEADAIPADDALESAEETISEQTDNISADSNAGARNIAVYVLAALAIAIIAAIIVVIICITARKKRK